MFFIALLMNLEVIIDALSKHSFNNQIIPYLLIFYDDQFLFYKYTFPTEKLKDIHFIEFLKYTLIYCINKLQSNVL